MSDQSEIIRQLIDEGVRGGDFLRQVEERQGHVFVPVGSVDWLPATDWTPGTIVYRDGHEVRLVALDAWRPFSGAFKRLVAALTKADLVPVAIGPLQIMKAILQNWSWVETQVGEGQTRVEEWRPPKVIPIVWLGDMKVLGSPPAKLYKALAVIAQVMHQTYEASGEFKPGITRQSCILCSLTVRDFLQSIGFHEAELAPVVCIMMATAPDGALRHSLGIGDPDLRKAQQHERNRWNGHMVVRLPHLRWLIDTTLYQANRPQWPSLPGMLAVQTFPSREERMWGLRALGGMAVKEDAGRFDLVWLNQPHNQSYKKGPDFEPSRRKPVVKAMVEAFGEWRGK